MKKQLLTAAFAASLSALFLSACGQDNNPVNNVREASADPGLQAKDFHGNCSVKPIDAILTGILTGGDAAIKSARTEYRFVGANMSRKTRLFTTADCTGDTAATFTESGSFEIKSDGKTSDGGTFIDFDLTKLEIVVQSPKGIEVANSINLCGSNTWKQNEQLEVTTKSGDVNCYGAQVPRRVANVYKLENSNLYLGTQSKGDVSVRPSSVNRNDIYVAK